MIRQFVTRILFILALLSIPVFAEAGEGTLVSRTPGNVSPDKIIQQFASKEGEFKQAREHYTYEQSVVVQTLEGNSPDGEYQQTTAVLFDDQGKRVENVLYAPQNTLQRISMTREDMDDIENRMPFVLTSNDLPQYNVSYVGQQQEDELQTYVFDVAPKQIEKGHRYFQGRIWVDQQDFQIVKTRGKSVPDIHKHDQENLFPEWTTYREQVDGHYWFPTYTRADDVLHFKSGDVPIRIVVKYSDYKRFGSDSKIIYDGQEVKNDPQQRPH
jgi:hypothetical protein